MVESMNVSFSYILHHTTSLFVTVVSTVITSVPVLNTDTVITTELRGAAAWDIGGKS